MRRSGLLLWMLLFVTGCAMKNENMERALKLRAELLAASEVNFHCAIVADYGDQIHTFSMDCQGDTQGDLRFMVTEPTSISGVTGTVAQEGGKLTFDDKVLFFTLMTDDQFSPITAPWIFLRTMRSGYIRAVGEDGELTRLTLEDSYAENVLQVDVWFDQKDTPVRGDILYDGKRILSLEIETFDIR